MPAPVINGIINFLVQKLDINIWEGEIPRYDQNGQPIFPGTTTNPANWPIVKLTMPESGFQREWTFLDPYDDKGTILIQIWGTTRASVEALMNSIEAQLAQATNWAQIQLGGPAANPYYVISLLLENWYCVQEEGVRTNLSTYLYRGEMKYTADIHGAIPTS